MSVRPINLTLGTAGHIDHGKTALVRCLTGCETDRLKAEKERGMSIDLGHAPCQIGDLHFGIVDVPGHENFVKTMVAGASCMDAVMLVVAADDGVMPQTREHLDILTLLNVRHGLVALTKIDRVDAARLAAVEDELRVYLRGTFLDGSPILPVSNVTGDGLTELVEALDALVHRIPPRRIDGVFRLPIDRAFSAKGYGTIVAGVPLAGSAALGDDVVLLPAGAPGRIRRIEVYGHPAERLMAGQCASINVGQWDHRQIERGQTVTVPGYFEPATYYVCRLRMLEPEALLNKAAGLGGLKSGTQVKFHAGTSEVIATCYPLASVAVAPGEETIVQFRLDHPAVAAPGDRFIIRALSPVQTVGGGYVVESASRRLKRGKPGLLDDLEARADAVANPIRWVEYCIRTARRLAVGEDELARRAKLTRARTRELVADLEIRGKVVSPSAGALMHRDTAAAMERILLETIGQFHRQSPDSPGMLPGELRDHIASSKPVFDGLVAGLASRGLLVETAGRLALGGHKPEFAGPDARHVEAIERLFESSCYKPPGVDEAADQLKLERRTVQRLVNTLLEHGRLVRVAEGLFFHEKAVKQARQILLDHFAREERLESVRFKYLLDTTRKFAIPLLDYFDRVGVTRRDGNTRYLKKR
ncbi:MAG: selenocysteine-specific translation elongation factor [Pirellulales bacterium]|nr:selenocysteine-specific translation elongation factor [Pirellulales bacterium]